MSPSYIVYAGPKEKKAEPVPEPQAEPEPEPETPLSENGGSKVRECDGDGGVRGERMCVISYDGLIQEGQLCYEHGDSHRYT